ncbi:hypothetical protein [Niallia taxi]|uniref:hypothetical protein n=1 Tax=Niallia taxi TaxID=2499688 RepID=UPI0015F3CFBB|nr:hypothetical protein [Niallia taxi]
MLFLELVFIPFIIGGFISSLTGLLTRSVKLEFKIIKNDKGQTGFRSSILIYFVTGGVIGMFIINLFRAIQLI